MNKLILLLAISLTGCAEWQAVKAGVGSHGAKIADEALATNIWGICNAASTGAIKRRFKTDQDKIALSTLCGDRPAGLYESVLAAACAPDNLADKSGEELRVLNGLCEGL